MKKLVFSALCLSLSLLTSNVSAQVVEEGKVIVSAGYGISLYSGKLLNTLETAGSTITTFNNNYFGKFEYMLNDDWGMGLNYFNSNTGFKETYTRDVYDQFGNLTGQATVHNEIRYAVQAFNVRVNRHFFSNDHFDAYFGFGTGVKFGKLSFTSDDPDYALSGSIDPIPLALEATLGARYFITPNIGLYGEMGLARTFGQIGLSAAF